MPILETEDYEEMVERNKQQDSRKIAGVKPADSTELVAQEGQALIYFTAFISRDSLSSIADDIGLDEEAWREEFRYHEEWEIEALVNVKTGEIIEAKLA